MTASRDKIISRISSMMQKSADKGATVDEAETALRMAQEMMERYGVTEEQVLASESSSKAFTWGRFYRAQVVPDYQKFLCMAIAHYTGTRTFVNGMPGDEAMVFFGYSADVQTAHFVYQICSSAVQTAWLPFENLVPPQFREEYEKNFKVAMVMRLGNRMADLHDERQEASKGTDLVILKDQKIEEALSEVAELEKEYLPAPLVADNPVITMAGFLAGDSVSFNREITE